MPRHGPGLGRGFGRIELQYLGWFSSLVPTLHWIESPWFACPLGLAGLSVGGLLNGSPAVIVIRHVSSFSVAKNTRGWNHATGKANFEIFALQVDPFRRFCLVCFGQKFSEKATSSDSVPTTVNQASLPE